MKLSDQVAKAKDHFCGYIDDLLTKYEERRLRRKDEGITVVNFVGHGRCGKDTAAKHLAEITKVEYGGATSGVINPLIAWSLGLSEERSFVSRHENRAYWFDWCSEFRRGDPSILCRMVLGKGDVCVGTRARVELLTAMKEEVFDVVTWINKVDTGVDESMEYDARDVLMLTRWEWIDNNKDVLHLRSEVERIATTLHMLGD